MKGSSRIRPYAGKGGEKINPRGFRHRKSSERVLEQTALPLSLWVPASAVGVNA